MRANSRARASTIAGVTVPMPSAFSIMIPLFSGFFFMFQSLLRTSVASGLSEEYFCHHSLIFMTQEMTVEERHAANDGISEIHHEIDRTAIGDIHGIDPYWIFHRFIIDGIRQEVDLMNVKRMHFSGWIQHAPMLQRTDIHRQHWTCIHLEFLAIDVETLFVLGEGHSKLRRAGFNVFQSFRRERYVNRSSSWRITGFEV